MRGDDTFQQVHLLLLFSSSYKFIGSISWLLEVKNKLFTNSEISTDTYALPQKA